VPALLTEIQEPAVDLAFPTIEPSAALELRLEISDPEILLELRKRQVGQERTQFALTALRIGVLSLRAAVGQLDTRTVKEAGDQLVADIREVLTIRAADLTNALAKSLMQYFDPATGLLSQKLEGLTKRDGELTRVLNQHLGEDSVLASTLAVYLGEESPVFKLLSPGDAQGIRAQVEATLNAALLEQRRHFLQEFSLDQEGSALSRLVREMQEIQERLRSDFAGQAEKIRSEFSLDKSDSALCRLVSKVDNAQKSIADQFSSDNDASVMNRLSKLLTNTSTAINKNLTLDDDQSALSRLKREIDSAINGLIQRNDAFHSEVRETLARLDARRQEAARSTSHGAAFEDQVAGILTVESQKLGDLFEATGNTTGIIRNCKVGDCVTELGPDSQAPKARIVWEAKEDGSYDLKRALSEMETARKNRQAQIGVFVFSRNTAPEGLGYFNRYGNDIVIIWDACDPVNDIFVHAAYSVGRALAVRQRAVAAKTGETTHEIELAVRAVEKHIRQLEDIETWAGTIESNSKKILDRSKRMREALIDEVGRLDDTLGVLKSEAEVRT